MVRQEAVVPGEDVQVERQPAEGEAEDDGDEHANAPPLALQQKEPPPLGEGPHRLPPPEEEANVEVAVAGDADGEDVLGGEGVQGEVEGGGAAVEVVDLAAGDRRHLRVEVVHDDAAVLRVGQGEAQRDGPHRREDGPGGQAASVGAERRGGGGPFAGQTAAAAGAQAAVQTAEAAPQGRGGQLAQEDVVGGGGGVVVVKGVGVKVGLVVVVMMMMASS